VVTNGIGRRFVGRLRFEPTLLGARNRSRVPCRG
jgi:hypothetical protein